MNYILHVAPAASHQSPRVFGTIMGILVIAAFIAVIVCRLVHHLKKHNFFVALWRVFMDLLAFPPILFVVLFLPGLWLNKITDDWFNEHGWLTGILFLLVFGVCEALVYLYHQKNKDN